MKRQQRWLFNLAAAASAACCLGLLALWLASQFQGYGAVVFLATDRDYIMVSKRHWIVLGYDHRAPQRRRSFVAFDTPLFSTTPQQVILEAPTAVPVILAAGLPGLWAGLWAARRYRQRIAERRHQLGQCRNCGYDLRGSAQRCPECGTVAANRIHSETDSRDATRPLKDDEIRMP